MYVSFVPLLVKPAEGTHISLCLYQCGEESQANELERDAKQAPDV